MLGLTGGNGDVSGAAQIYFHAPERQK